MSTPTPREAIAELAHRYSDAVVYRDLEKWGACWAEDSRWVLSPKRTVSGRAAIIELWRSSVAQFRAIVQVTHNGEVHVDGDAGTGRWYISEHYLRADGAPGILLAHYDDSYACIDGSWLFTSRALVVQYIGAPDLSGAFLNDTER